MIHFRPESLHLDHDPEIILDGSWEKKNRNITAAAFAGLIGIGALYFNLQSFLSIIFIAFSNIYIDVDLSGDFFSSMDTLFREYKIPVLAALFISQFGFMFLPAIWITHGWHSKNISGYLRIRKVPFTELILTVFITLTLLPSAYLISELFVSLFEIPEKFMNLGEELFKADSGTGYIIMIFVVAVTPAVCEEILFRGYFQRTLERTLGIKSIFITGIIFGLFHMQPLGLIVLSLLGILFSFFYYRSKSILPPMTSHFINNIVAVTILYIGIDSSIISNVFIVAVSLGVSLMLIINYLRLTEGRSETEPELKRYEEIVIPNAEYKFEA
jgi:uncharacterized protein